MNAMSKIRIHDMSAYRDILHIAARSAGGWTLESAGRAEAVFRSDDGRSAVVLRTAGRRNGTLPADAFLAAPSGTKRPLLLDAKSVLPANAPGLWPRDALRCCADAALAEARSLLEGGAA